MRAEWTDLLQLLYQHVVPAVGCTEPISAALAAAEAARLLGQPPEQIQLRVSPNLLKNAMAVMVPGTGSVGLPIAAAAGALGGDADAGLEVLAKLTAQQVLEAKALVERGAVTVSTCASDQPVFCEVRVSCGPNNSACVRIEGGHTQIVYRELNGQPRPVSTSDCLISEPDRFESPTTVAEIFAFATQVPVAELKFLQVAAELNKTLSDEGLRGEYGLKVGATIALNIARGFLSNDLSQEVMKRTAAASDARMGGAMLAAMSNSGSGNQGIAATLPVTTCARKVYASPEQELRALALSHLLAIHIRLHLAPLSALCAAITASAGASGAICWLLGGDLKQVEAAITNVLADLSGVFCDGAKPGCALKVSSGAGAAVKAALLAREGIRVDQTQGIIAADLEQTIEHLALLGNRAMPETDRMIIKIMQGKSAA